MALQLIMQASRITTLIPAFFTAGKPELVVLFIDLSSDDYLPLLLDRNLFVKIKRRKGRV